MRDSARSYVGILADVEYPFLLLENQLLFGNCQKASACINSVSTPVAIFEGADDERVPRSQRLSTTLDDSGRTNISISLCEETPRSGHTGMWLSKDALSYRLAHKVDTHIDLDQSNQLDHEYIRSILRFYRSALET